jgi:2,4-dienoyl-CoA reductase-like NADH-dependent reductase (Old Yellow Enzyme family)
MKNRFMLAPLTNTQSHEDGILSDDEYRWLVKRAQGGFGLTMTCAAHVQEQGRGFPGQLGIFADAHLEGLKRLASGIQSFDSVSIVQLHHAGMRSPEALIGTVPQCPSDNERSGARGLSLNETRVLIEDFVAAAERAERAGFEGVEIHGAHGYILCQYFSSSINTRTDEYGGTLENRYRILFEIIEGIRQRCGANFMVGVRLSPERFGLHLPEVISVAQRLMQEGQIDFLDMSLWDVFKEPEDPDFQGRSLMSYFTELPRGKTRLGVAGMIRTPTDAVSTLEAGADWIMLGRAAMLHHDFPARLADDPGFTPVELPVTRAHFANEGLSERFIDYVESGWPDYIAD